MYSICFTIAGFIFSLLLFVLYHFKSNFRLAENKIYYGIIVTTIFSCLMEIYSFILVRYNISISSNLYLFALKLLFFGFVTWLYLFTLYIVVVTIKLKNKDYDKYRFSVIASIVIFGIIAFITVILPISIDNVNGLLLPSGVGVDIIYVLAIVFFVIMIATIISNRREMKNKKYYPMYFLLVLLGIIILVQKIFPSLLLINFSLSVLIYIMYFTIENPDIKTIKELNYTKKLLVKQNEVVSGIINNLAISIKNPLMKITTFSNKKIEKNDVESSIKEIKKFQKLSLDLVDQINKVIDLTRIESRELKIKERMYQVNNLISSIKDIINIKNVDANYNIDENIPKVLYGDDDNIKQIITYLIEFISNYFERYSLNVIISKLVVRNNCKLTFEFLVDYRCTDLELNEKNDKYDVITGSGEYELYEKLVELQKGSTFIKKNNFTLTFGFSLFQKIKDISRKSTDEIVNYFDCSDKNVLIALDNHNDIKRMTDMLIGYNVDISTAGSISELTELLRSDKTFDLVFLSNTISGIENYNIDTDEDLKRTFTKLSLVAGYKLQIVIVSLYDYKKNDIEFLLMPISKVELDDIMVKYLSEK